MNVKPTSQQAHGHMQDFFLVKRQRQGSKAAIERSGIESHIFHKA